MSSRSPQDSLARELASWRVTPPRDPRFRTGVWARIEAAARPSAWTQFARAHAALVSALLVGALAVGALTGRVEAQHKSDRYNDLIAASYVHSLDARWMRHP